MDDTRRLVAIIAAVSLLVVAIGAGWFLLAGDAPGDCAAHDMQIGDDYC